MNLPPPSSNESIFEKLEVRIDNSTLARIKKLREVRNDLTHAYSHFDDLRLFNVLTPDDYMHDFLDEVKKLVLK